MQLRDFAEVVLFAMKYLVLSFVVCVLTLGVLLKFQRETNPFADGHLVCLPMPAAFERPRVVAQLPPGPVNLTKLQNPPAPVAVSQAKIEIFEPEPDNRRLAEVRQSDQSDWGFSRFERTEPLVMASLMQPKIVKPVPVITPTPIPTPQIIHPTPPPQSAEMKPTPIQPNLYLPEGALNEEGANLTLIKAELKAHKDPDEKSEASPFSLKEGDEVRPLTRLRNEKDFDWIKIERDGKSWWAKAEYFIRVDPRNRVSPEVRNIPVGQEVVDRNSALPAVYFPSDMVTVSSGYMLDTREVKLRKEAIEALESMVLAAAKQGLKLRIFSGYRDFDHQKRLYLEAIEKKGPKQNGTAAPGYSEHQLGTTVDICNTDKSYVLSGKFAETSEGRWLFQNVDKFGFRHSYTWENSDDSGYKAEPWHLRYVGVQKTNGLKNNIANANANVGMKR